MTLTDKEIQARREEMKEDLVPLRIKAGRYGYIIRYGRTKTKELGFYITNKETGEEKKAQSLRGVAIELENIEKSKEGVYTEAPLLCLECGAGYDGDPKIECSYCGSDRVMVDEGAPTGEPEYHGYYSPYADAVSERQIGNYNSNNHR